MMFPECRSSVSSQLQQPGTGLLLGRPSHFDGTAEVCSSCFINLVLDFVQFSACVMKSFAPRNSEAIVRSSVISQIIQNVCILLSKPPTISMYRRILRDFSK